LLLLYLIYYISRIKEWIKIENYLNNIFHFYSIFFIISLFLSLLMIRVVLFNVFLLAALIFFIFDFFIKRILTSKIEENNRKWNLIRALYYIFFYLMMFSLFGYSYLLTDAAGVIILIVIILITIVFILYLKTYEKTLILE